MRGLRPDQAPVPDPDAPREPAGEPGVMGDDHDRRTVPVEVVQQVDDVRATGDALRRETTALSTALRKPQVRGRWGELHLRRAVELAGLVRHCDFSEQVSAQSDEQRMRPDLVVHLAGGKRVVVDAKVPLDAFLDAIRTYRKPESAP